MPTGHTSGNLNDIRAYPFADTASRVASNGARMPESVLNDCHIWWPSAYGDVGFVSSATVSPSLVTMTFAAVNTTTSAITVIAAVQIPRPYVKYRSYPITPMQDGVAGWVAIGNVPESMTGVNTWLFDTYQNAALLPRVAHAYPAYPVTTVTEEGNVNQLQGVVRFSAGSNLTIGEGYRYIEGSLRRCIVFSLNVDRLPDLYELFAGPCGKRPESGNCGRDAIRTINGVGPDCLGRIFLEIDTSNSVLNGYVDATGAGNGIVLSTPVEYGDMCAPVAAMPITYCDACASLSSSFAAVEEHSSSSGSAVESVESSSSAAAYFEHAYTWASLAELRDWSPFSRVDHHTPDWDFGPGYNGSSYSPTYENGSLVMRSSNQRYQTVSIFNNAFKADLVAEDDFIELEVSFRNLWSELRGLTPSETLIRRIFIELTNEYPVWKDSPYDYLQQGPNTHKVTFKIDFNRDLTYLNAVINGFVWDGDTQYSFGDENPLLAWDMLSGAISSSSAFYFIDEYLDSVMRVRLTRLTPQSSSSSGVPMGNWSVEAMINDVVVASEVINVANDISDIRFFHISLPNNDIADDDTNPLSFHLDSVALRGTRLCRQECDEPDVVSISSAVPYAIEYDPDSGYSNDFGSARAVYQFLMQPNELMFQEQDPTLNGSEIVIPKQYLELTGGSNHKYALLKCSNSVLADEGGSTGYIMSAAFRAISGSPKVGLVIGYQDGSDNDVFWSIVVDLVNHRMTYGIHYTIGTGHRFERAGWVNIPGTDSTWPSEWHRLVMRVTLGSNYGISIWIDPHVAGSSSSAQNLTKVIPINYLEPLYSIARSVWTGSLLLGPIQFANGRGGVYAYGGSAKVAEFTMTPIGEDIVVPNKVTWLHV